MANISDIIEEFILKQLEEDEAINLSRRELADFFNCAPSQINYVLSTRFTTPRGYMVESHRGGGGYIKLVRVDMNKDMYLQSLLSNVLCYDIDYVAGLNIINNLIKKDYIDENQGRILNYAIMPKALATPVMSDGKIRAGVLRNVVLNLIKEGK
ncbi:MAG: CtsR family transcriptional regulator [Clostridia bacterium]|nr:CtsR family transcriptional regulator [Clostridia bacterium]